MVEKLGRLVEVFRSFAVATASLVKPCEGTKDVRHAAVVDCISNVF